MTRREETRLWHDYWNAQAQFGPFEVCWTEFIADMKKREIVGEKQCQECKRRAHHLPTCSRIKQPERKA